ncbi:MAG: lamin tail domain-containing protein [Verrucomicrobiales bacterium]
MCVRCLPESRRNTSAVGARTDICSRLAPIRPPPDDSRRRRSRCRGSRRQEPSLPHQRPGQDSLEPSGGWRAALADRSLQGSRCLAPPDLSEKVPALRPPRQGSKGRFSWQTLVCSCRKLGRSLILSGTSRSPHEISPFRLCGRGAFTLCPTAAPQIGDSIVAEIQYNPAGTTDAGGEWIELHNLNAVSVDMSAWQLEGGVEFTFPDDTVIPGGGFLVIARDPGAAEAPAGALGPWAGGLDNGGEELRLVNNSGRLMSVVDFRDGGDWPAAADGSGATLSKRHGTLGAHEAASWTWSEQIGGTPGAANFAEPGFPSTTQPIEFFSEWKFDGSGADQGTAWREVGFDDSGWQTGEAGFSVGSVEIVGPPPENPPGVWYSALWAGDADSEISAAKTYTHKINLNDATAVSINSVAFDSPGAGVRSGANWELLGAPNNFSDNTTNVSGGGNTLLNDFFYGATENGTSKLKLTGLTPNQSYILTLYGEGFGGPGGRWTTLTPSDTNVGEDFDQNYSDNDNGNRIYYHYYAPSSGEITITLQPFGVDTWHHYAFTNEEAGPVAIEQPIQGVSIEDFSSELAGGFTRLAVHCVNGNGLEADGTHSVVPDGNMWLSNGVFNGGTDPLPAQITFDLGANYDLEAMHIWNYNEQTNGLHTRGCKDVEILVASSEGGAFTSVGNFVFDQATGLPTYAGQRIAFDQSGVRLVRFNILTNHGGDNEFAGLSEVQFRYLGPPPPLDRRIQVPLDAVPSSGIAADGSRLLPGIVDPRWTNLTDAQPVLAATNHPAWLANNSRSQWIGFTANGADNIPFGTWTFQSTFDLTGVNLADSKIAFRVATDNSLDSVVLNGSNLGITQSGFALMSDPFDITGNVVAGPNTIQLTWSNAGTAVNPGALRVQNESTTVPQWSRTTLAGGQPTYYFRRIFQVNGDPTSDYYLYLEGVVDDGAVFYLNGTEVHRLNMPAGAPSFATRAAADVADVMFMERVLLPGGALAAGDNVFAVEVHQSPDGDDDLFFAAELELIEVPKLVETPAALAISEIAGTAAAAGEFFVELQNQSGSGVDLGGYALRTSGGAEVALTGTIAAGGFLAIDEATLGFRLADGDRIFLIAPGGLQVVDAAVADDQPRALLGRGEPYDRESMAVPSAPTPGAANTFALHDEIVINEIMYHHRADLGTPDTPGTFNDAEILGWAAGWRYLQDAAGLADGWEASAHPSWSSGTGLIGFETAPLQPIGTTLNNPLLNSPFITTYYFETEFNVTQGQIDAMDALLLETIIDDGAIFYLNGVEIVRQDMPDDPVDAATFASVGGESELVSIELDKSVLVAGSNRISVEVHQASDTSSDILMGARLSAREVVTPFIPGTPYAEDPEEWIELHNRGAAEVDLSGWALEEAVRFTFPDGTTLGAGGYLVVARDAAALSAKFPGATILGDWSGQLRNGSERIVLTDATGNPADAVRFRDGKPWPEAADGGGSSLELVNPAADNALPQSWAASAEGGDSAWTTVAYRGVASEPPGSNNPNFWNEFNMGLLWAGEFLLDDVQVIIDPDGAATNLILDGTFDAGGAGWRFRGTHGGHGKTKVIPEPGNAGNNVLHVVATGATEHMHNQLETMLQSSGIEHTINAAATYEIRFRAKWLSGSRQLHSRLYFNRLARVTHLNAPALHGTPGAANSALVPNAGPDLRGMAHAPAVPLPGVPVRVEISAADPDGVAGVTLHFSVEGGPFQGVAMADEGEGVFAATIPGAESGEHIQFYAEAQDALGGIAFYPPGGEDSRAMYQVSDERQRFDLGHNFRIVMTPDDTAFLHDPINVMSNDLLGCTVIYREQEIFYDCGIRLKSSQRGRNTSGRLGFAIEFPSDQPFRGIHDSVKMDRSTITRSSVGNIFGSGEITSWHFINRAGGVPALTNDICHLLPPRNSETGSSQLVMADFDDTFFENVYGSGSNNPIYKYELIYFPTTTQGGNRQDPKLPQPDSVSGVNIRDMGNDKNAYRWNFLLGNARERDDYAPMIRLAKAFSQAGSDFYESIDAALDVDQWLRASAAMELIGAVDHYSANSQHNLKMYERPTDGKIIYVPWDHDYLAGGATDGVTRNADLARMVQDPHLAHLYYGHLHDIMAKSYNTAYMQAWCDHYQSFTTGGQNFQQIADFIALRAAHVQTLCTQAAPPTAFGITSNGGADFDHGESQVTLTGSGWVDVREIRLASTGQSLPLDWTAITAWSVTVPLGAGANSIQLIAIDLNGQQVGADAITVTNTGPLAAAGPGDLAVSEMMFNPADATQAEIDAGFANNDDFEYIEVANISGGPLDLTGVAFTDGISATFDNSTQLAAGERAVLVKNLAAFQLRYAALLGSVKIAGSYASGGNLANGGEAVALSSATGEAIESFAFGDGEPW